MNRAMNTDRNSDGTAEGSHERTSEGTQERSREWQYIDEIRLLLQRPWKDYNPYLNILLLGKTGAGKSAVVNTLAKALVGKYVQKAKVGKGRVNSKTLELKKYRNLGISDVDIESSTYFSCLKDVYHKLPNIWDATGLGNEDTEQLREILKLLLGGYISPETSIKFLEQQQKEHGVGNLDIFYGKANPLWKIHKIVFVQSCMDTIPKKLIHCLFTVIEEASPETGLLTLTNDIFIIMTKCDRVKDGELPDSSQDNGSTADERETHSDEFQSEGVENVINSQRQQKTTITQAHFLETETSLAKEFSIEGALQQNLIRWASLVDETGLEEESKIDITALKFLKLIISHAPPEKEYGRQVITPWRRMKLWFRTQMRQYNEKGITITPAIGIFVFIAAIILGIIMFLSKPVG